MSKNIRKNNISKLVMVTTVLLAASALVYSCKSNSAVHTNNPVAAQDAAINMAVNDTLQTGYNNARMQIDELMTRNAHMDSQLARKNAEIALLNRKLQTYQKDTRRYDAQLKAAKEMVASLTEQARGFADRIGLLRQERNEMAGQRDSLMQQYMALKKLGSVLHASNISLTAIHLKHNGRKEKKTARARKANILRVDFDIDENRIAEDGVKDLYLVIKSPDGSLLEKNVADPEMISTYNGNAIAYTLRKEISLKQAVPVKGIVADWKQEDEYKKGTYDVEIYNGGYEIGHGIVALK